MTIALAPTLGAVEFASGAIAYLDSSPDAFAPTATVVCVHGIPTSSRLWRGVARALADAPVRVLAPDLPGFGASEPPADGDQSLPALSRHLGAFVDAVAGSAAPIHLVVHDIGGPVGLIWAAAHRERIASLTILNTTVFPLRFRPPLPAVIAVVPFFGRLVIEYGMRERVFKSLLGRVMTRADAATLDAYWEPYRDPRMRRALAATFSGYPRSAAAVRRVRHGLGDLSMPVEILFGAEDPHCPPPNARAFAAAMPNANATVLAGVGHFVPEEEPARVAGAIRRAIERHETASAVARQSALAGRDA